jgi:hypothetical protein
MNDGTEQDVQPSARRFADKYGDRREITVGSILAAAALAWTLATAWTGFRDDIYDHTHDLDVRVVGLEQYRLNHATAASEWYTRITRAEQRIESCLISIMPPDERKQLNERLRQLELKVR